MADKNEVARRLAESHYRTDVSTVCIYRLESDPQREASPDEPIKLLEVNEATIASGILPLQFDAHPERGIDYPCVIVEVTPEEYEEIKHDRLKLPYSWQIGETLPPPQEAQSTEA